MGSSSRLSQLASPGSNLPFRFHYPLKVLLEEDFPLSRTIFCNLCKRVASNPQTAGSQLLSQLQRMRVLIPQTFKWDPWTSGAYAIIRAFSFPIHQFLSPERVFPSHFIRPSGNYCTNLCTFRPTFRTYNQGTKSKAKPDSFAFKNERTWSKRERPFPKKREWKARPLSSKKGNHLAMIEEASRPNVDYPYT